MNAARREAQLKGLTRYEGKPCIHCGCTTRLVCNTGCVECNRKRANRTYYKMKAKIAEYAALTGASNGQN